MSGVLGARARTLGCVWVRGQASPFLWVLLPLQLVGMLPGCVSACVLSVTGDLAHGKAWDLSVTSCTAALHSSLQCRHQRRNLPQLSQYGCGGPELGTLTLVPSMRPSPSLWPALDKPTLPQTDNPMGPSPRHCTDLLVCSVRGPASLCGGPRCPRGDLRPRMCMCRVCLERPTTRTGEGPGVTEGCGALRPGPHVQGCSHNRSLIECLLSACCMPGPVPGHLE